MEKLAPKFSTTRAYENRFWRKWVLLTARVQRLVFLAGKVIYPRNEVKQFRAATFNNSCLRESFLKKKRFPLTARVQKISSLRAVL